MGASAHVGQKIFSYFKESYHELKRVVWPSRKQTIAHTIGVILFSVIIALFLGALDVLFSLGMETLLLGR